MPAQFVIIRESDAEPIAEAIRARGYSVKHYADPVLATHALEQASTIEVLITCVRFRRGRSNGRSIALMVRQKRPSVKLLFLCEPEDKQHVADLGECLPVSASPEQVGAKAESLLAAPARDDKATPNRAPGSDLTRK